MLFTSRSLVLFFLRVSEKENRGILPRTMECIQETRERISRYTYEIRFHSKILKIQRFPPNQKRNY